MIWIEFLRWLHVIGATVLLGTGAGIAFFLMMAHRTGDAGHIALTARTVVIADFIFTATAVVVQPVTGILLAVRLGWPLTEGWIVLSLVLYVLVGMFWLPVVWIQYRMKELAETAVRNGDPLTERYHRLYRIWFLCGIPAFLMVLSIFWLMIARPSI